MTQDPISKTTATYDEIAAHYAARWQDRGTLREHLTRFVDLMPEKGAVCAKIVNYILSTQTMLCTQHCLCKGRRAT